MAKKFIHSGTFWVKNKTKQKNTTNIQVAKLKQKSIKCLLEKERVLLWNVAFVHYIEYMSHIDMLINISIRKYYTFVHAEL